MQMGPNTMASKLLIHVIAMTMRVLINYFANLAEFNAWLYKLNSFVHRFSCYLTESLNIRMDFYFISLK